MGDIITLFTVGIIISSIARIYHPYRINMNIYTTIIIGILGALISQIGIPFNLYDKGSILSFLLPIMTVSLFIFIYGQFKSSHH